jgi:transposase
MGDRTRDAVRLEKLLEDASIKLSVVASSVTTLSAREMLAELVAGNTDAVAMADLAHGKMRRKLPDLAEALTGHFDEHHALLVGAMLHRLEHVEAARCSSTSTPVRAVRPDRVPARPQTGRPRRRALDAARVRPWPWPAPRRRANLR